MKLLVLPHVKVTTHSPKPPSSEEQYSCYQASECRVRKNHLSWSLCETSRLPITLTKALNEGHVLVLCTQTPRYSILGVRVFGGLWKMQPTLI